MENATRFFVAAVLPADQDVGSDSAIGRLPPPGVPSAVADSGRIRFGNGLRAAPRT
jgi:hypothetical protein